MLKGQIKYLHMRMSRGTLEFLTQALGSVWMPKEIKSVPRLSKPTKHQDSFLNDPVDIYLLSHSEIY